MPQKNPIVVIADGENIKLYRNVFTGDEVVQGYSIPEAANGIRACEADMVILDCGFSPDAGLDFLKKIKSLSPQVPVIFLTDLSSEDIAISAFRSGAVEYFKKPVNLPCLRDTAVNLLTVKRAERDRRKRAHRPAARDEDVSLLSTELPSCLLQAVCYIDSNLASAITLEQLACEAHLSKYHFCRLFKKHTGMSPKKFLSARRIERAKKLLGNNGCSNVSLAASEVGFNDVNNFIKSFKKITGVTPSAFKRSPCSKSQAQRKGEICPD